MAAYMLQWQRWVVVTEGRGPAKPTIFTIWSSVQKVFWPLIQVIPHLNSMPAGHMPMPPECFHAPFTHVTALKSFMFQPPPYRTVARLCGAPVKFADCHCWVLAPQERVLYKFWVSGLFNHSPSYLYPKILGFYPASSPGYFLKMKFYFLFLKILFIYF